MGKKGAVQNHFNKTGYYHTGTAEKKGIDQTKSSGNFPDPEKQNENKQTQQCDHMVVTMMIFHIQLLG